MYYYVLYDFNWWSVSVGGAGVSGDNGGMPPGIGGSRRNRFPDLKGIA